MDNQLIPLRFRVSVHTRKRIFVLAFCTLSGLGLPLTLFAQVNGDFDPAFYIHQTVENVRLERWDSVLYYNKIVDSVCGKMDNLEQWILYYYVIGNDSCFRKDEDAVAALKFLLIPAKSSFRAPRSYNEWKLLARLHLRIAFIYNSYLQNYMLARDYYELYITIYQNNLPRNDIYLAQYVLQPLANVYAKLRDFDKARHYLEASLAIFLEQNEWDLAAKCYSDIGVMLTTKKDYQESIRYFHKGLNLPDFGPDEQLFLLINLGAALVNEGEVEEAMRVSIEAKEVLETVGDSINESHRYEHWADLYENMGLIHTVRREWAKAVEDYQKNIEYYLKKYDGECNRDVSQSYNALGQLYNEWNRPDSALHYAQMALRCLLKHVPLENDYSEPIVTDLWAEHTFYLIFEEKISAYNSRSYQFPSDSTYLIRCLHACDLLFYVGELLRQEYIFEPTKLYRQQANRRHFETALSACHRLWNLTKNKHWVERAFQYADLARERVQVENLQKQERRDLPAAIRYQMDSIQQQSIRIRTYLFEKSQILTTKESDSLKSILFYLSLDHEKLSNPAAVPADSIGIPWVKLEQIRDILLPDQALLEYFLGDSSIYILSVTKKDLNIWRKPKPAELQKKLEDLLRSITDKVLRLNFLDEPLFAESSDWLYRLLLEEPVRQLEQNTNKLIIVPDGLLCYLPFDLLGRRRDGEVVDFRSYPYLLQRFTVSYAYSSSLLELQSERSSRVNSTSGMKLFAGFAANYSESNDERSGGFSRARRYLLDEKKYNLPGAVEEVEEIAKMLNGDSYIGSTATEHAFKMQADQYRILHLAMHAFLDESEPLFSKLLFTKVESVSDDPDQTITEEDNDLNAIELYDMCLPAELAVLSGCETGKGFLQPGEGMMSLSRAFFSAGVHATVMSLWKAPDRATKNLMVSFYSFLKSPGMRKDEALQKAKLEYLDKSPSALCRPYYWAGFISTGDMKAIF